MKEDDHIIADEYLAGASIDRLVAEKVMRWPVVTEAASAAEKQRRPQVAVYTNDFSLLSKTSNDWSPSTHIADAWQVARRFYPYIKIDGRGIHPVTNQGAWCCSIWVGGPEIKGFASTAQLAICQAALAAVKEDQERTDAVAVAKRKLKELGT